MSQNSSSIVQIDDNSSQFNMDESINGKDLKNHEIIKNSGSTANHNLNDDIEEKAINLITFD